MASGGANGSRTTRTIVRNKLAFHSQVTVDYSIVMNIVRKEDVRHVDDDEKKKRKKECEMKVRRQIFSFTQRNVEGAIHSSYEKPVYNHLSTL